MKTLIALFFVSFLSFLSYAQDNSLLIHKKWYFCDTNFYVGLDTNVYSSILMNLNSDYCSKIDTYNKGYIEFFENNFFEIKNEMPCSPPEISIEGGVKSIFVSLCSSVYQGRFQFISDWNIQLDNYIYSIDILDEDNLLLRFVGVDDKRDLFQIRVDSLNKN